MKLKPYPDYKASGVPWLGEVPTHWNVRKLRSLLKPINEKNQPHLPLLSVVREKGIIKRDISSKEENHNFIPEDLNNYKVVRSGQFAMNKMKAWQGSYGISKYEGVVSPAYFVFDLKDVDADFFHLAIRSQSYVSFFGQASDGVRVGQWDLSQVRMKEIPFAIPDEDEQIKIIQFLNYKTIQTNKFIRNKRSLIKLLNEQKQAIINQAVTRGIDFNVPLKPSGVSYIGNVPAHWDIVRLKYLFAEVDDRSPTGGETLLSLRMYKGLVPHAEVSDKPIASTELIGYKRVKKPEIVMNRMRASVGMFAVTCSPGIVSPDYAIFRQITELSPDYYVHLFKIHLMRARFRIESRGLGTGSSGFLRLYSESFGSIFVPKAPIEEQVKIVEYIDAATNKLNTAIERTYNEIELIQEYRNRLISDVVTGKIDVREIEIPALPDEEAVEDLVDEEFLEASEAELEAVEEADE